MHSFKYIITSVPLLVLPLANAQCQASNALTDPSNTNTSPIVNTDPTLCVPQSDPNLWTFAMSVFLDCVPEPGAGAEGSLGSCEGSGAGQAAPADFFIFDSGCAMRGAYSAPSCGVPYIIEENYQPDVLIIQTVAMTVGSPYFEFAYGDATYQTGVNGCGCQDASQGLEAIDHCQCPFYVTGVTPTISVAGAVAAGIGAALQGASTSAAS